MVYEQIKADGVIRAGTEQKRAAVAAEEKRAKREAAAAETGEVPSEEVSGSPQGKNAAIEDSAQGRLFRDAAETQVRATRVGGAVAGGQAVAAPSRLLLHR